MAVVKIADVVVPEVFGPYTQQLTQEKSRLIQSGLMTVDPELSRLLGGGGLTFNAPSFTDLANDVENTATDNDASDAVPNKLGSATEISVRLTRNQAWSSMALTAALAGADPMAAIANRVSDYWARRLQAMFVAMMTGIFADNDAAPDVSEHVAGDLTVDIKGGAYSAGVTDFTAEAFLDAVGTAGDSAENLTAVAVHSVVYQRMQKNNLIDFIPDSNGVISIPSFLGRQVIVDDGMPATAGVYESWIFGPGAVRLGVGTPDTPVEVFRTQLSGDGGGQETLINRVMWMPHVVGHRYDATAASGGPTNASTTNNLAHAASFKRVYLERKQIKIARLITRES